MVKDTTASAFSNYRQLTLAELQLAQLLIQVNPSEHEPREVIEARQIVVNAYKAICQLNTDGFVPIIDSFPYSVLKGRERIK